MFSLLLPKELQYSWRSHVHPGFIINFVIWVLCQIHHHNFDCFIKFPFSHNFHKFDDHYHYIGHLSMSTWHCQGSSRKTKSYILNIYITYILNIYQIYSASCLMIYISTVYKTKTTPSLKFIWARWRWRKIPPGTTWCCRGSLPPVQMRTPSQDPNY